MYLDTQAQVDEFDCSIVDGFLWVTGPGITNVDGLSGLTYVSEWLFINATETMTHVNGLGSLTSIGDLNISTNAGLTNVEGLAALTSVERNLTIWGNPVLHDLDGLESLTEVGTGVSISTHSALANIDGLSSLTSIGDYLYIWYNDALTNVDGLAALESIGGQVNILANGVLGDLDGLSALGSIGGSLFVDNNDALANVDGLGALNSVGEHLSVIYNDVLTNVDGLAGLDFVGGDLGVWGNPQLSDCACGLLGVLATGGVSGSVNINDNATGCSSWSEIVAEGSTYPECGCSTLKSEIVDLVADGILTPGQGLALGTRLNQALKKAEDGKYKVAINLANTFIRQVLGLLEDGVLSEEQAAPLIGRAALLIKIWSEL
jgi:hypothetical protein